MQPASARPLVLRQVPIWEDGAAKGFVDLALERAYVYRPQAPSEIVEIPKDMLAREKEARFAMLERLADYTTSSWSSFSTIWSRRATGSSPI
jgi:elongation factor G